MKIPIENIVRLCKKRDRKGQELLYKQFSPLLFSVCLRYADSYEDAQDNFQEGFVTIYNKIDQFNFEGSFEGWMKRIMINTSLVKYRKQKDQFIEDLTQISDSMDQDDDHENEDINLYYQDLIEIVQNLPSQYRQVFNLYILEEYSHQEIADLLQISIGTSKSNLSRARKIVKDKLKVLKTVSKHE